MHRRLAIIALTLVAAGCDPTTPAADAPAPPDAGPLDALALDAGGLDAPAALDAPIPIDAPFDADLPPPIYYPVTRHVVVQGIEMVPFAPMQVIEGASYTIEPALPLGLTLDPDTGAISGTPSGTSPATDYHIAATTPSGPRARTVTLSVRRGAPDELTYTFLEPTYTVGIDIPTNVPAHVAASRGAPVPTFSVSPALPSGLRLGSNGFITGRPTTAGTSTHTVTATNGYGSDSCTLTIHVVTTAPASLVIADLVPAESGPVASIAGIIQMPFPWLADPCGIGSILLTDDGRGIRHVLRDGCRWTQEYRTEPPAAYARSELALIRSIGAFPPGVTTTVEWRGYFPDPLPPADPARTLANAILQVHNNTPGSPMFAFAISVPSAEVLLVRHDEHGAVIRPFTPIADYASFATARTIRVHLTTNTEVGGVLQADGAFRVELDDVEIVSLTGIITSDTPGEDYLKIGLYDWGRALTDPALPEREREFEMVTESLRVYQ